MVYEYSIGIGLTGSPTDPTRNCLLVLDRELGSVKDVSRLFCDGSLMDCDRRWVVDEELESSMLENSSGLSSLCGVSDSCKEGFFKDFKNMTINSCTGDSEVEDEACLLRKCFH